MKKIQPNFDEFYEGLYGQRWENLRASLLKSEDEVGNKVRRYNSFALLKENETTEFIPWLNHCIWNLKSEEIPRDNNQLLTYYVLDPASVLVAENLQVQPGEKVLDLCAAPGGKSLIIAQALFRIPSDQSQLILNEISADRRERLKKVIQNYVPFPIRQQIWLRGKDGARLGLEMQNEFDAILVDAPCSGEQHLLKNKQEFNNWSVSRTKGLAQKQYALLCSAWLALKPGGRIIYSTCSISKYENDGVIDRFITKKSNVEVLPLKLKSHGVEETSFGNLYLPDHCGFGPMYSCQLIKKL